MAHRMHALQVLASALIVAGRLPMPCSAQQPTDEPIIISVDVEKLTTQLNLKLDLHAVEVNSRDRSVGYAAPQGTERGCRSMGVAVHADVESAQAAFRRASFEVAVGPAVSIDGEDGYDLRCWSTAPEQIATVRLRVVNVTARFGWVGRMSDALDLARSMAQLLATSAEVAPRGTEVPVPSLEITVPEPVLAGKETKVTVKVTDGPRVRLASRVSLRTADADEAHSAGSYDFAPGFSSEVTAALSLPNPGHYELELTLATEGNTVFTKTCDVNVVSRAQWPEALPLHWEVWGDRLYFLRSADGEWGKQTSRQQEWLDFGLGRLPIRAGAETFRQQALDDITQVIQERWLPSVEFLQPVEECAVQPRMLCHASYTMRGCRIVYMGVLGRQVFLYIEQPDPLPEGQKRLTRADVLRDDLLQTVADEHGATSYPRVQFVAREMKRYRAMSYQGPYEPVHILLVDARLPDDVNLRSPGYR
ncbi:MAG TPA: hypothetical protein DGT21_06780 [Armatimonadetes bacterium]|nr:hypothetical protein [Armatimonadota bacterium]